MLKGKYLIDKIESPILLPLVIGKHPPKANIEIRTCMHLVLICGLETRFWKSLGIHSADTCDRSSNHMTICVNPKCRISAHSHVSYKNKWFAFKIPEFWGLFCLLRLLIIYYQMDCSLSWWTINVWKNSKIVLKHYDIRNQQKHHMLYAIWFDKCMKTIRWKKMKISTVNKWLFKHEILFPISAMLFDDQLYFFSHH